MTYGSNKFPTDAHGGAPPSGNLFVARLFDWDKASERGGPAWLCNRVLRKLKIQWQLTPALDASRDMTNIEQRINLFHLLDQVLAFHVPGDVIELGCFDGKASVLFEKTIERYEPRRTLHVYDNFGSPFHLKGSVQDALRDNFLESGARLPMIHAGDFGLTVPKDLPDTICFAHIDCGTGGDVTEHADHVRYCLEHVYPRLAPGAVCLVMDYYETGVSPGWNYNPGAEKACRAFLADKPETMTLLWAGQYTHGFFRKIR